MFCQWEVLAGIGGRKRTRSVRSSAKVLLPAHLSSADWATTSSLPFRLRDKWLPTDADPLRSERWAVQGLWVLARMVRGLDVIELG